MNWDLYRFFLAVAETGSLSGAARKLGVSQPTVGRQINELENSLQSKLFLRESHGYSLSPVGESVLSKIKNVGADISQVSRQVEGLDNELSGSVRIAATEGFGSYWLTSRLAELQEKHSNIDINLLLDQEALKSNERDADLRVRFMSDVESGQDSTLLGYVGFGVYGTEKYLQKHAKPESLLDIPDHKFVDWDLALEGYPLSQELSKLVPESAVVYRTNRISAQIEAVLSGLGLILTPHYIAARFPELIRLIPAELNARMEAYLICHPDFKHTARVQTVQSFIVEQFARDEFSLAYGKSVA